MLLQLSLSISVNLNVFECVHQVGCRITTMCGGSVWRSLWNCPAASILQPESFLLCGTTIKRLCWPTSSKSTWVSMSLSLSPPVSIEAVSVLDNNPVCGVQVSKVKCLMVQASQWRTQWWRSEVAGIYVHSEPINMGNTTVCCYLGTTHSQ